MNQLQRTHFPARKGRIRARLASGLAALCLGLMGKTGAAEDATNRTPNLSDLPLERLMEIEVPTVTAATKSERKVSEVPASVSVITSDEIKRYGHRSLADVLQSAAGFHVSYDRNYAFLGARGINL